MSSYAISAKIKSMYSECLNNDDYRELMSKNDVGEIFEYLKNNTSYSDVLEALTHKDMHRGKIENLLNHKLFTQYIRLYNFMDKHDRDILRFWFMRMEIEFLKHKIRYLFNKESENHEVFDDENSEFFREHTKIDCESVSKAGNLSEFAECCRNTAFYKLLKTSETINADYFSIAMMLDRYYYIMLWKAKNNMPPEEKTAFEEYLGPLADMMNIMWIYRGKKYFNFDSNFIYTYIIPVRYRLSEENIRNMVSGEGVQAVIDTVKNTSYKLLFNNIDKNTFPEENFHDIEFRNAKKIFYTKTKTMAAVFAYFKIKQIEIYNLTTVIEGVRYEVSPELISRYVKL